MPLPELRRQRWPRPTAYEPEIEDRASAEFRQAFQGTFKTLETKYVVATAPIEPEDLLAAVRRMSADQRARLGRMLGIEAPHPTLYLPRRDRFPASAFRWLRPLWEVGRADFGATVERPDSPHNRSK
jgi:hypothetical protein